jgi:cytochrome c peroxidase
MKHSYVACALLSLVGCVTDGEPEISEENLSSTDSELFGRKLPNNFPMINEFGFATTWSAEGSVDLRNAFFKEFGTNDRTCGSCHKPTEGWSVSASRIRLVFELTGGRDPIFRTNDGSNSPHADVSTVSKRRQAYSMLLNRGTIRVGIGMPANADFELIGVEDPYGFASAAELSLFRRPLASTNLAAIPRVMWDGRVTGATIEDALKEQANGATQGHAARPTPLNDETRQQIVDFETALFSAQQFSVGVGLTNGGGSSGGAEALAGQSIVASRFNLFDSWQNSPLPQRQAAWRGQELFNTKLRTNGGGACRGCHSAENFGTNVNGTFFNVNVSAVQFRKADQPLYTFRRISDGTTIQTTDPGRALITGLWTDMNRFKVPSMRGLAGRAPYFHDGSAKTLLELVRFYETSLTFDFNEQEEQDLVAFMSAL